MRLWPQLQELKNSLPELRYLAVYDSLTQDWVWIYDALNSVLLPAAVVFSEPQPSFALADFVSEVVQYDDLIEYNLRCNSHVISCISERKNLNLKLLELWLSKQSESILALDVSQAQVSAIPAKAAEPGPERVMSAKPDIVAAKSKARSKSESPPKAKSADKAVSAAIESAAKQQAASEAVKSPQETTADWLQLRFPGAVQLRKLSQRKQMMSFLIQDSATQAKYLARVFPATRFKPEAWQQWAADGADPSGRSDYELAESQPGFTLLRRPWLKAVSLRELLGQMGKLTLNQSLLLLGKIQAELEPYHASGRSHSNLHPDNIFFDIEHKVILVDAGLTKMNQGSQTQAQAVALWAGQPLFLAPEQLLKQVHGPAADIFALGALQLYMLMGAEQFAGLSAQDSVDARVTAMHVLARSVLKDSVESEALDKILKLSAFSPDERPAKLTSPKAVSQIKKSKAPAVSKKIKP